MASVPSESQRSLDVFEDDVSLDGHCDPLLKAKKKECMGAIPENHVESSTSLPVSADEETSEFTRKFVEQLTKREDERERSKNKVTLESTQSMRELSSTKALLIREKGVKRASSVRFESRRASVDGKIEPTGNRGPSRLERSKSDGKNGLFADSSPQNQPKTQTRQLTGMGNSMNSVHQSVLRSKEGDKAEEKKNFNPRSLLRRKSEGIGRKSFSGNPHPLSR